MSSVREKRSAVAKAQMQAIKKAEADVAKGIVPTETRMKTEAPKKSGRPKGSTVKKAPAKKAPAKKKTAAKKSAAKKG
jgi:hypothetical protein